MGYGKLFLTDREGSRSEGVKMKYYSTKTEAIAEANARRAAGETVKVFQSVQWIPGSGKNAGYAAVRFFVEVSA